MKKNQSIVLNSTTHKAVDRDLSLSGVKKIVIAGVMLMLVPFGVFAQTAATAPVATTTIGTVEPGLVPGDFFYFLDNIGEKLNLVFTFNKEKKAQLHLQYAKERVAEINKVLQKPDAKLEDVASAKENFDSQIADAATIVKSEKDAGNNVADLARQLDDELDMSRGDLKDILHNHQNNAGQAEMALRAKIDAITSGAASTTSATELQGLTQALDSLTKERDNAAQEENNIDTSVSDEQATFEDAMGKEMAAEKHMEQAMRLKAHIDEISAQFGDQAGSLATTSEQLMLQAKAAIQRGDFEAAKNLSKEAVHGFEKAKEVQNDFEMGLPAPDEMINDGINADESSLNNLDQEINKGESMMERGDGNLDGERPGNSSERGVNRAPGVGQLLPQGRVMIDGAGAEQLDNEVKANNR